MASPDRVVRGLYSGGTVDVTFGALRWPRSSRCWSAPSPGRVPRVPGAGGMSRRRGSCGAASPSARTAIGAMALSCPRRELIARDAEILQVDSFRSRDRRLRAFLEISLLRGALPVPSHLGQQLSGAAAVRICKKHSFGACGVPVLGFARAMFRRWGVNT
jgi:hypothetical protein